MISTLTNVLDSKGRDVFSVSSKDNLVSAINEMASRAIGTALVIDEGKVVGIVSERDFIRKVVVQGRNPEDVTVGDIMTREVLVAKPDSSVEECLQLMTGKRIRHLPVLAEDKVLGIVSIGDLVKYKLSEQDETIRDYQKYIYQGY